MIALLKDPRVLSYLAAERRAELLRALNDVNVARADAHANDLSKENWDKVKLSFDMLEGEFLIP